MQQIPIGVDANDYRVTVELSGVVYVLHMKWNSEGQFWVLGIENLNEQVQLAGVKVIHTSPLLQLFHYLAIPPGEVVVTNETDRMAFVENRGQMYYLTAQETEEYQSAWNQVVGRTPSFSKNTIQPNAVYQYLNTNLPGFAAENFTLYANLLDQKFATPWQFKPFTDLFTLTRSTSRMCWNATGVLEAVPANQPCYEYDPVTGEALGQYVYSRSVTNLVTYSNNGFGPGWSVGGNASATPNAAQDPEGGNTLAKLEDADTSLSGFAYIDSTISDDTETYTASFYVRQGSASKSSIVLKCKGGATETGLSIIKLDWSSKTTTLSGAAIEGGLEDCGGGIYRLWASIANNEQGNTYVRSVLYPTSNDAVTDTGYVYAGYCQVEKARKMHHYVPTNGAAATCTGDTLRLAQMPPSYGPGAFVMGAYLYGDPTAGRSDLLVGGGQLVFNWDNNYIRSHTDNGSGYKLVGSDLLDTPAQINMALSFTNNAAKFCSNGGSVDSYSGATSFANISSPRIGLNTEMYFKSLTYIPSNTLLTDQQMQEITG